LICRRVDQAHKERTEWPSLSRLTNPVRRARRLRFRGIIWLSSSQRLQAYRLGSSRSHSGQHFRARSKDDGSGQDLAIEQRNFHFHGVLRIRCDCNVAPLVTGAIHGKGQKCCRCSSRKKRYRRSVGGPVDRRTTTFWEYTRMIADEPLSRRLIGLRKHEDELNARVMTPNLKVAAKLFCECVYQSHSQALLRRGIEVRRQADALVTYRDRNFRFCLSDLNPRFATSV
jgi:hypothetical protein